MAIPPDLRKERQTMAERDWFDVPMRWGQLTLTDTDPGSFDPDFWLDYFRRSRCDGAVIGTGGYMAFHRTDIPYHYTSATLGDSDVFGYLVNGCRSMGMSVLCRTDAHAVHEDARLAHPEWIAKDSNGSLREHWAMPGVWVTCALGPYNFEFMHEVNKEIVRRYEIDGIFCNRWAGSGVCYCDSCKELFKAFSGIDIPTAVTRNDPSMIRYLEWREERLFELCEHWDSAIREINPSARFIPNSGGGATSDLDTVRLGEYSDILFIDRQGRHGTLPPWANGRNGKELRAVMGRKPIGGIFSSGVEEKFRWKDSVQSEAELRVWVAEAVANGLRPWFTKFCGRVYDDRWMPVVEDMYRRYADWEPYLRLKEPVADVAIVFSQDTTRYYAGDHADELVDAPICGFYQALLEERIPFEMIHAETLSAERLSGFRTVILPNTAALSERECEVLRSYVRNGGGLVATFESSLYDSRGNRRDDFELADVFGVHAKPGPIESGLKNSYLQLNGDCALDTTIVHRGLEHARRLINAVSRVPVTSSSNVYNPGPYSYVPPYPDLPMEEVYPRESTDASPEIFHSEFGRGRVVYFCGDIDRRFWEFLTPDQGKVLVNSVLWTMNDRRSIKVAGQGYIDVTCWRDDQTLCVHIVNMTNPHAMRGPMREIFPVSHLDVSVRLPDGRRGVARSLSSGATLESSENGEWLCVHLSEVLVHEAIVISLH